MKFFAWLFPLIGVTFLIRREPILCAEGLRDCDFDADAAGVDGS